MRLESLLLCWQIPAIWTLFWVTWVQPTLSYCSLRSISILPSYPYLFPPNDVANKVCVDFYVYAACCASLIDLITLTMLMKSRNYESPLMLCYLISHRHKDFPQYFGLNVIVRSIEIHCYSEKYIKDIDISPVTCKPLTGLKLQCWRFATVISNQSQYFFVQDLCWCFANVPPA
jgi:hypothetical protein